MRVIKFRAWDGLNNRMLTGCEGQMPISHYTDVAKSSFNGSAVEQFTGLHDKNGKEIFEGDIVSHKRHISAPCDYHTGEPAYTEGDCVRVGHITITTSKGVVLNGSLTFTPDDDSETEKRKYRGNPGCWGSFSEVIGNIHENPELVESK